MDHGVPTHVFQVLVNVVETSCLRVLISLFLDGLFADKVFSNFRPKAVSRVVLLHISSRVFGVDESEFSALRFVVTLPAMDAF